MYTHIHTYSLAHMRTFIEKNYKGDKTKANVCEHPQIFSGIQTLATAYLCLMDKKSTLGDILNRFYIHAIITFIVLMY